MTTAASKRRQMRHPSQPGPFLEDMVTEEGARADELLPQFPISHRSSVDMGYVEAISAWYEGQSRHTKAVIEGSDSGIPDIVRVGLHYAMEQVREKLGDDLEHGIIVAIVPDEQISDFDQRLELHLDRDALYEATQQHGESYHVLHPGFVDYMVERIKTVTNEGKEPDGAVILNSLGYAVHEGVTLSVSAREYRSEFGLPGGELNHVLGFRRGDMQIGTGHQSSHMWAAMVPGGYSTKLSRTGTVTSFQDNRIAMSPFETEMAGSYRTLDSELESKPHVPERAQMTIDA